MEAGAHLSYEAGQATTQSVRSQRPGTDMGRETRCLPALLRQERDRLRGARFWERVLCGGDRRPVGKSDLPWLRRRQKPVMGPGAPLLPRRTLCRASEERDHDLWQAPADPGG